MKTARLFLAACLSLCCAAVMAGEEETLVPNSLADATVGQWASYRLPNDYIQKLTVVERDGNGPEAMVTISIENIYEGDVVNVHEYSHEAGVSPTPPRIPDGDDATVTVRQDSLEVRGATMPVTVIVITREDAGEKRVTEWWTTESVPVFGIVKRVEDGEVQWEIEDWGDA